MFDLLNRIWSRPRGVWTRVLRRELPSLADRTVAEMEHSIPAMSALLREIDREDLQWVVEQALLPALGYKRRTAKSAGRGRSPGVTAAGTPTADALTADGTQ